MCVKTNCCCVRTLKYLQTKCVWGGPAPLSAWPGTMISTDNLSSILYSQTLRQSDYLPHMFILWSNFFQTWMLYFWQENTVTSRGQSSHIRYQACQDQRTVATLSNTKHEYKILHFKLLAVGFGTRYKFSNIIETKFYIVSNLTKLDASAMINI